MSKGDLQALCKQLLANREQIETSVIYEDKPAKSEDHPTMKPIKLFARQISNSTEPGQIVLDTFGGSGTTIMAAEQLNRKARLMELDPHYCDVIIARWEKFTGLQAELLQ
jgi:DNA modification methylase